MYEKRGVARGVVLCCIGIVGSGCATQPTTPGRYASAPSSSTVDVSGPPAPARTEGERPRTAGEQFVADSREVWGWISDSFREHPKTWIAGIAFVVWGGKRLSEEPRRTPNTNPSPPQPSPPSCFDGSVFCWGAGR